MTNSSDSIAALAIAAVFRQFGVAADYTPTGGVMKGITVMHSNPDLMVAPVGIAQRGESSMIEMMVSEVPSPKKGDVLVIKGDGNAIADEAFVLSTPRHPDRRRLKWAVELYRG